MSTIQAIETRYKGYRFRSRLEARWAVFFDALDVKWEYEKEGYELPSGRYLPDFWLPEVGAGCFVEIKPTSLAESEQRSIRELAEFSDKYVMAFCGSPWPGDHEVFQFKRKPEPPPEVVEVLEMFGVQMWMYWFFKWENFYLPQISRLRPVAWNPLNESKRCLAYCRNHKYLFFGHEYVSSSHCENCYHLPEKKKMMTVGLCGWMRNDHDGAGGECSEITDGHEIAAAFSAARSARFEYGESG